MPATGTRRAIAAGSLRQDVAQPCRSEQTTPATFTCLVSRGIPGLAEARHHAVRLVQMTDALHVGLYRSGLPVAPGRNPLPRAGTACGEVRTQGLAGLPIRLRQPWP